MEGIVAKFNCVRPQLGFISEAKDGQESKILDPKLTREYHAQVWTSEGKTELAPVLLHTPPQLNELIAKGIDLCPQNRPIPIESLKQITEAAKSLELIPKLAPSAVSAVQSKQ